MKTFCYDIETYPNCFLFGIYDGDRFLQLEVSDEVNQLPTILSLLNAEGLEWFGFHSKSFDKPICEALRRGDVTTAAEIKRLADDVIADAAWRRDGKEGRHPRNAEIRGYRFDSPLRHGDLMEIMKVGDADKFSLKFCEARMGIVVKDLPFHHDAVLTPEQARVLREYHRHDLVATHELYLKAQDAIQLRRDIEAEYGVSFMESGESSIGERIIEIEYARAEGRVPFNPLFNTDPSPISVSSIVPLVRFQSPSLTEMYERLNRMTLVTDAGGKGSKRHFLDADGTVVRKLLVRVGDTDYTVASGGLHAVIGSLDVSSNNTHVIIDADVASYYPSMQIAERIAPGHLNADVFIGLLRDFREKRYQLKALRKSDDPAVRSRANQQDAALKIALNAIFGKAGSKYSKLLYDPTVVPRITMTGQLLDLQLIERLTLAGHRVISANTDSITIYAERSRVAEINELIAAWEAEHDLKMETEFLSRLAMRDINNYISIAENGKTKAKGIYVHQRAATSVNNFPVIVRAVEANLLHGTPMSETIRDFTSLADYSAVVRVNRGDVVRHGEAIVKERAIRFYEAVEGKPLEKQASRGWNKCPLPGFASAGDSVTVTNDRDIRNAPCPDDLDFRWYEIAAGEALFRLRSGTEAERLRTLGLHPLPKARKKTAFGISLKEIGRVKAYDCENVAGLGIATGPSFNTLVIDVDYPEVAGDIIPLLGDAMKVWNRDPARAKYVYQYADTDLAQFTSVRKEKGFEVLYGNTVPQVLGVHTSGHEYLTAGNPAPLPEALKQYLLLFDGMKKAVKKNLALLRKKERDANRKSSSLPESVTVSDGFSTLDDPIERPVVTIEQARSWLAMIPNDEAANIDRPTWLNVGFALHAVSGTLLADWVAWSEQHPSHVPGDCESRWDTMNDEGGITGNYLYYLAREATEPLPQSMPLVEHSVETTKPEPVAATAEDRAAHPNDGFIDLAPGSVRGKPAHEVTDAIPTPAPAAAADEGSDASREWDISLDVSKYPPLLLQLASEMKKSTSITQRDDFVHVVNAIAVAGALIGKRVSCENKMSIYYPTVWTVTLADSGSNKSGVCDTIDRSLSGKAVNVLSGGNMTMAALFNECGVSAPKKEWSLMNERAKSEWRKQRLDEARQYTDGRIFVVDECLGFLKNLCGGHGDAGSGNRNLQEVLRLADCANNITNSTVTNGFSGIFDNATSVVAFSQPALWYEWISQEVNKESGMFGRFLPISDRVRVKGLPDTDLDMSAGVAGAVGDITYRLSCLVGRVCVPLKNHPHNDQLKVAVEQLRTSTVWTKYGRFVGDDLDTIWNGKLYYLGLRLALVLATLDADPEAIRRDHKNGTETAIDATKWFGTAIEIVLKAYMASHKLQQSVASRDPRMTKLKLMVEEMGAVTRREISLRCFSGKDRTEANTNSLVMAALREGMVACFQKNKDAAFAEIQRKHRRTHPKVMELFVLN